jgi:hypothetical protein
MMNNYKCFLKLQGSEKVSLVELPWTNRPIVGQTKPISAAEVDPRTPMPDGRTLGAYAVPRVVIKIVGDLGEQKHLGETHPTFEYVRGSL